METQKEMFVDKLAVAFIIWHKYTFEKSPFQLKYKIKRIYISHVCKKIPITGQLTDPQTTTSQLYSM